MPYPEVGAPAPDFELGTDDGATVSLTALRGQKVVLYFYPKDDTTGCTKEAIEFSALKDDFEAAETTVIGISPDSLRRHDSFRRKHALTVRLAADPERQAIEAYGVWQEKSMYGRSYMGVARTTFLIDAAGKVAQIWTKVKVAGHAAAVLDAARKI